MAKEIERKFLVPDTSFLSAFIGTNIKQGYLEQRTVALGQADGETFLLVSALAQEISARIEVPEEDFAGLTAALAADHLTVRVRVKGDKGFLTLKGPTVGITRDEFEYAMPVRLVHAFLLGPRVVGGVVEKKRYAVKHSGHLFEVDVFGGKLSGLVVAEVEMENADDVVEIPDWAGEEVSDDPRYYNSNLANTDAPPTR